MAIDVNNPCPVSRRVTLRIAQLDSVGEFLLIEPACRDVLGEIKTHRARLVNTGNAGANIQIEPELLLPNQAIQAPLLRNGPWEDGEFVVTYPGLQRAIEVKLLAAKLDVRVYARSTADLIGPDWDNVARMGTVDREFVEFVRQHDRGLIRYGSGVDPARLVGELALAYPENSLVVPVKKTATAHSITNSLLKWTTDVMRLIQHGWEPLDTSRVAVALLGRLGYGSVGISHRDIYLAVDAREAISTRGLEGLKRAWHARVFGLLPIDAKLSAAEWDRLRCWFGFAECEVPAHGCIRLPMVVVRVPFRNQPRAQGVATNLDVKRQEIWQHPVRNRLVARLAKQLRAGDRDALAESYPAVAQAMSSGDRFRVAILVENIEHLVALLKQLPGWSVIAGPDVNTAGMSRPDCALLDAARTTLGPSDAGIVTATGAATFDFTRFDAVIRADGGLGLPTGLQCATITHDEHAQPLLLVDFDDRHHPVCRPWSRSRRDAYQEAGWYAPGADPVDERVREFLLTRTK